MNALNSVYFSSVRLIVDIERLFETAVHRKVADESKIHKMSVKLVLKVSTFDNEDIRVAFCLEILDRVTSDPNFVIKAITGDESWRFQCDSET
ncbi:hypothetical protein NPIL_250291 [Nephila pilipes]|uniref:Uncharacterized protein n=1 Tax=Nephila pilipes TaxID=299642 RepID=A0A8X6NHS6_NEPPI|nr:hypothetical protein NPIL_250291 [Nephila pilipes]